MPLTVENRGVKKAIPATPASTLAQIFMQACATFKVDADTHALRHKKKDLDLTLPLRLANLPSGAVAELCELDPSESAKRIVQVLCTCSGEFVWRSGVITQPRDKASSQVALQREDSSRTQGTFACSNSLWEVLKKFEDLGGTRLVSECAERGEVPCVSFMNSKKFEGKEVRVRMYLCMLVLKYEMQTWYGIH